MLLEEQHKPQTTDSPQWPDSEAKVSALTLQLPTPVLAGEGASDERGDGEARKGRKRKRSTKQQKAGRNSRRGKK